jgi:hypothetical protein
MGCTSPGEQIFHRAALALARNRERRDEDRRENQNNADQPRHDLEHRQLFRVIAGVNHKLDGMRQRVLYGKPAADPCWGLPLRPEARPPHF